MLRRSLLVGSLAALAGAVLFAGVRARCRSPDAASAERAAALPKVKDAVLAATEYDAAAVEVAATAVQLVVTVVNSGLAGAPAAEREREAKRIASAVAGTVAAEPALKGVQAIHVDYVAREPGGGRARRVDGIDFRKAPQGNFRHHVT